MRDHEEALMTPAEELRCRAEEVENDAWLIRYVDPAAHKRLTHVAEEMRDLARRLPPPAREDQP